MKKEKKKKHSREKKHKQERGKGQNIIGKELCQKKDRGRKEICVQKLGKKKEREMNVVDVF